MIHIYQHKYVLFLFFVITSLFSWFTADYNAFFAKNMNPLIIMLIESFSIFIILLIALPLYFKGDIKSIYSQLCQIKLYDILYLFIFALFGVIFGAIGILLLSHHGVSYYKSVEYIIDILAGVLGVFLFTQKNITWRQKLALVFIGFGSYLFT